MRISDLRPEEVRSYFESRGLKFHGNSVRQIVRCILHQDKNPSLSVDLSKAVWRCWAGCGEGGLVAFEMLHAAHQDSRRAMKAIFESVGQQFESTGNEEEPEMIYTYTDERGEMLFQKLRFKGLNADGSKRFIIRKPTDGGGWAYTSKDVRKVLYNLPDVIKSNQVAVTEGERDAENFALLGMEAFDPSGNSRIAVTTNFDGGRNWDSKYARYFCGKDVVILPHFDKTGIERSVKVANSIRDYALTIKIVDLPYTREHEDLTDYLQTHSARELLEQIQKAKQWVPKKTALLISVPEFLSQSDVEIDWLVQGLIQRGANGFIVASPKVGKSYMSIDMAIAIALGREWMGFPIPKRAKVAYISREDTPALTRWRIRKLLETWRVDNSELDQWMHINSRDQSQQFKLDVPEQFNEMLAGLKDFSPEIVFLDVLNIMHSSEENDNTEMRKVLDKADELGRELGCSIGVLHHFNKETKARLTERIRGASSMSGWVEWVIGLHKDKEEDDEDTLRWAEFDLKAASAPNHLYFHIQGYDNYENKVSRGCDPTDIRRMAIEKAEAPAKKPRRKRDDGDVSVP